MTATKYFCLLWILLIISTLCNTEENTESVSTSDTDANQNDVQQSEILSNDETDKGQKVDIPEPKRDKYGIWQLTDDQFDPFLDSYPEVAVLFTRGDDLYSYAGKYHFDRAAHILKDLRNSSTQFAVIEGDRRQSKIHDEFSISDYPTIKYCHHDYLSPSLIKLQQNNNSDSDKDNNNNNNNEIVQNGQDQEWEIRCLDFNHHVIELMVVRWIEGLNSQTQCSFTIHNIEEFEKAKNNHQILFVGFFNSVQDIEYKLYEDLCKQYKWEHDIWSYEPSFAVVIENEEFAKTLSENIPGLIVYCEFKEHAWIFNGPLTDRGAIRSFVETERYPYFTQITAFNFKQYTQELDLPLIWVAIDDEYESYVKKVGRFYENFGIEYKGYLSIIWISSNSYMGHIRKLGFPFVPGVMYIDEKNNYKQLYDPQSSILDYDKIKQFIDSCLDGSGQLFIKSQDENEIERAINNDREMMQKDNVLIKHVNGNELADILERNEAKYAKYNVVVFYYAPWDSRCAQFHPIYERIAEILLNEDGTEMYDDLLLLKMDATENDTPHDIAVYPKIYLYRNEMWPKTTSNKNWAVYSKRREEHRFVKWIQQQCGYEMDDDDTVQIGIDSNGQQQSIDNDDKVDDKENEEKEPFEYY
eukprot:CAMPEP_0201569606 /NCGR_PEP_ID=MMETSP0190_2-20130828/11391_1 /ASSEMBLY_ACC=CAM_ASM_000263 /TAXON_ID=37353 /ORGANISM="Rosalina sp." /LENGTH=638 /DNA_ID=CAMNT_0047992109 /DNA_START=18 /DNA_END=1934 /DNA_ORIENTATION=+